MDNKYGLGSGKLAHVHHDIHHKEISQVEIICKFCGSANLMLCQTMNDHRCLDCDEWQNDVSMGYATGRSSDY